MLNLLNCFGVWAILLVFWQKSGYQGNNLLIRKKMEEKVCREIVFFKSLSDSEQKILNNYRKNTRKIVRTTFKVFRGTILGRFFGMNKLCSSFLFVERKYWAFGVNFLSKFLKSTAYGRNGTFWCFFLERRVFVWSFLVSERK